MPTAFTIGVRARRIAAPPTGPAQTTRIAWDGDSALTVAAGGLANNELAYNVGLIDWRGDNDALTTTAGGAVSAATSGQGIVGTALANGTAANQGTHDAAGNFILLSGAAANDAAGDFYAVPLVRDRYIANGQALGIVYLLLTQAAPFTAWDTTLMRIGENSGTFTRDSARAYILRRLANSSALRIIREGAASASYLQADIGGAMTTDTPVAIAWVLNDSRAAGVVNGTPDNVSRLFVKPRGGGLLTAQTANTTTVPNSASTLADIGRTRHNGFVVSGQANGLRIHAVGFDANPPITDTAIENNLDRLLTRVPA